MLKRFAVLSAIVLTLAACKNNDSTSPGPTVQDQQLACVNQVDLGLNKDLEVFGNDVIDGKAGRYALVEARQFVRFTDAGNVIFMAQRVRMSPYAIESDYVDAQQTVMCTNIDSLPTGRVSANMKLRLGFLRADGRALADKPRLFQAHMTLTGPDPDGGLSSSPGYDTSPDPYPSRSILMQDGGVDVAYFKLPNDRIAMRATSKEYKSEITFVAIYQLVP